MKLQPLRLQSKISPMQCVEIAFFIYLSYSFWIMVVNKILGNRSLSSFLILAVCYFLVLAVCMIDYKRYFKFDCAILYFGIFFFFLVTYLLHPEYAKFYSRNTYGAWDHIFIPYRGIYAYLFVRMIGDPQKIKKTVKISGWFMFVYFFRWLREATQRGYWLGVVGSDGSAEMSYSVAFGYNVLLYALFFLYDAMMEHKLVDIIASAISTALILAGGSRGPMFCVGVFIALYLFCYLEKSRKKTVVILFSVFVSVFLFVFYEKILVIISQVLTSIGISSRFIRMMINGTISSDSGRGTIWKAAFDMIKEKPWGYGALGSRFRISEIIYAGYPHNIVLEILIDFGVLFGSIILLILFINIWKMLFDKTNSAWRPVFIPLFSCACSLFLSMTFWSVPSFWACLGVGYTCIVKKKKGRVNPVE